MMLIPCPWCGARNQLEFAYGGDAGVSRPRPEASEADYAAYVYLRDNPCGPIDELWYHAAGCRSWFKVRRNTRTHEILGSGPVDRPILPGERQSASDTGAGATPGDGARG